MRHYSIELISTLALCAAFGGCAATSSNPQSASPSPQSGIVRPSDAWMRAMLWENLFAFGDGCGAWSEPAAAEPDVALDLPAGEPRNTLMEMRRGPAKLLRNSVLIARSTPPNTAGMLFAADGKEPRATTVYVLNEFKTESSNLGTINYLGMISSAAETSQTVTVKLSHEAYVYDVLTGEFLGQTASVKAEVWPYAVRLFAVMPYKVLGINCRSANACHRGALWRVGAAVAAKGTPGLHVLHMEVFDPNGKPVEAYDANLLLKEGKSVTGIQFAPDDLIGKWKINFRDVASGLDCDVLVELLPDAPPP